MPVVAFPNQFISVTTMSSLCSQNAGNSCISVEDPSKYFEGFCLSACCSVLNYIPTPGNDGNSSSTKGLNDPWNKFSIQSTQQFTWKPFQTIKNFLHVSYLKNIYHWEKKMYVIFNLVLDILLWSLMKKTVNDFIKISLTILKLSV